MKPASAAGRNLTARRPGADPLAHARRVHVCVWTLVVSVTATVLLQYLLCRGMFWDGVLYATIARNLAEGMGSLWKPVVTGTFMPHFHEHPPLAFWLQGLLFYLLGDHVWVERLYGIICGSLTAMLLTGIWRKLLRDEPLARACSWLPIGLWIPCSLWCYLHNMLEMTSGLFVTFSVYASVRSNNGGQRWPAWSLLAGAAVAAACLAKGPGGAFPLVTPLVAGYVLRQTRITSIVLAQALVLFGAAAPILLLMYYEPARCYLSEYWNDQVVSSLQGNRERVVAISGRLTILMFVARDLLPAFGGGGALMLLARWLGADPDAAAGPAVRLSHRGFVAADCRQRSSAHASGLGRPQWFCWLTALSASVPLVFCPKQTGHYAMPSFGFFALAIALACVPAVLRLLPRLAVLDGRRMFIALHAAAAIGVLVAVVIASRHCGQSCRDHELLDTTDQIAQVGWPHPCVAVANPSWQAIGTNDQLKLHAYLYRYHRISLLADEAHPAFYSERFRLVATERNWVCEPQPTFIAGGLVCSALVSHDQPPTATKSNRR